MTTGPFWWCRKHERVEGESSTCPPEDRLGPYESEVAAQNWKDRVEARNEEWDAEDREWTGDDDV